MSDRLTLALSSACEAKGKLDRFDSYLRDTYLPEKLRVQSFHGSACPGADVFADAVSVVVRIDESTIVQRARLLLEREVQSSLVSLLDAIREHDDGAAT